MRRFTERPQTKLVAIAKGSERYIYLYPDTPRGRDRIVNWFGVQAFDERLSLDVNDAALLAVAVRAQEETNAT